MTDLHARLREAAGKLHGLLSEAELAKIRRDPAGYAPLKSVVRTLLRHIEVAEVAARSLLDEIDALRGRQEWRDIATAPKDGTSILAVNRTIKEDPIAVYYDAETPDYPWWLPEGDVRLPFGRFTDWQPLPTSPKEPQP